MVALLACHAPSALRVCLQDARAELAPWEAKISEATGHRTVAESERRLLAQKQESARQRLQVLWRCCSPRIVHDCRLLKLCCHRAQRLQPPRRMQQLPPARQRCTTLKQSNISTGEPCFIMWAAHESVHIADA